MTTAATKVHPLVTAYQEAIAEREAATTAGVKAGATRRIATLSLEMAIEGVEFTEWTPPKPTSTKRPNRTDADLLARLDTVRQMRDGGRFSPAITATADAEVSRLTKVLGKRGVTIPAAKPAKTTRRTAKAAA